jgi:hypothetical protein
MTDDRITSTIEERDTQTGERPAVPDAVPNSWVADARSARRRALVAALRDALRPQPGDSWRRVRN